jgi:hypothetical protein
MRIEMILKMRRKQYSEKTICNHWLKTEIWQDKFDSPEEFLEQGNCFVCGFFMTILLKRILGI